MQLLNSLNHSAIGTMPTTAKKGNSSAGSTPPDGVSPQLSVITFSMYSINSRLEHALFGFYNLFEGHSLVWRYVVGGVV